MCFRQVGECGFYSLFVVEKGPFASSKNRRPFSLAQSKAQAKDIISLLEEDTEEGSVPLFYG